MKGKFLSIRERKIKLHSKILRNKLQQEKKAPHLQALFDANWTVQNTVWVCHRYRKRLCHWQQLSCQYSFFNFEEFLVKKKYQNTTLSAFENEGLTAEYQLYYFCSKWIKSQPDAQQMDQQRNHFSHTLPIFIRKDAEYSKAYK